MNTISYKTKSANAQTVDKKWVLVDADGQTLGRFASKVAFILRGKHKPSFTPHVDCGDNVVIVNAEKVVLTGMKAQTREYVRHTGYPGGQRTTTPEELFAKMPERVLEKAVRGMLPKTRLGRQMFRNLFVYKGAEHKQKAQQPQKIDINEIIK